MSDLPVLREVFGDAVTFAADPAALCAALADALDRPGLRSPRGRPGAGRPLHLGGGGPRHLDLYRSLTSRTTGTLVG